MNSCYTDQVNALGTAGDSAWMISNILLSQGNLSITLLNGTDSRILDRRSVPWESQHKLNLFTLTASSTMQLKQIIRFVKNTQWWNHLGLFLIIDTPAVFDDGCSNAYGLLRAVWNMNLLNVILICLHRTKGPLIFTYNPYTNQAPDSWQLVDIHRGKNGHPWYLFMQIYRRDSCEYMIFDKTTDLGGYEILASMLPEFGKRGVGRKNNNTTCIHGRDCLIQQLLFRALNGAPKFVIHSNQPLMNRNGKLSSYVLEVMSGITDISLISRYQLDPRFLTTTTHSEVEVTILIQYSGQLTQLSKITSIIDGYLQLEVLSVLLLTFIFFIFFLHLPFISSILKIILIVINGSLPNLPNDYASRFYLGSVLLFMLHFQGIFSGKLSTALTKSRPSLNAESIEDLANLGYTSYGNVVYAPIFKNSVIMNRYVSMNAYNCTHYVLRDASAACIGDTFMNAIDAAKFNLHLAKRPVAKLNIVYLIRPDWPLEKRTNEILTQIRETALIQLPYDNPIIKAFRKLEYNDFMNENQNFRVIVFQDLRFAFVILAIGLGLATLCFIMEISYGRVKVMLSILQQIFVKIFLGKNTNNRTV